MVAQRCLLMLLVALMALNGLPMGEDANMTMSCVSALPERDWQRIAVFPDRKGYTDDTLAMNSTVSYQGFHGQGKIWLSVSDEVECFALYVNGTKFDTTGMTGGVWSVDVSDVAVDGVNTVQVSNILPLGLKEAVTLHMPYPVVLDGDGLQGIQPQSLKLVEDIIQSDIDHGFTSAQLAIVRNGRLVYRNAWGRVNSYAPDGTRLTDAPMVNNDTLYDLASVSKMFSANYAVQKLVTDGLLDLDAPIVDILGDAFADETLDFAYANVEDAPDHATQIAWKRALTSRDLLRHQGGFPASPHYDDPDYDMATQAVGLPGANLCHATNRAETLNAICKTPLRYAPGSRTVYSDVDYMLLAFIVEAITGERLDIYMKENFYAPLGLEHITFLPLENGFAPEDCAATELNGNTRDGNVYYEGIRTGTIQGQVHDERAWGCMEGVSGHAGLFANATDLAKLASVMLTGGYGEKGFFSRNVIDLFTAPKATNFGQWGLGWSRQGDDQRTWYFGGEAAPNTVGHQGWTGTLAMIDPSRNLVIVYLTNKINSPVTDVSNLNKFDGNCYTASTLGFVPQLLEIGMDTGDDRAAQRLDLIADMAAESLKLIPEGADADHPYVRNAMSKIAVLREWAVDDADTLAFADVLEGQVTGQLQTPK